MKKFTLDWNEYFAAAREAAAEGAVLLENNGALPLKASEELAVFGRIQNHYYKSGTGSGGMVNVSKVWGIPEGLEECGIKLNPFLRGVYAKWEEENPVDPGLGWGGEPWSQAEMPLTEEICEKARETSAAALCIIGRTAGEEKDAANEKGSYLLTDLELDMLKKVRAAFPKMTVALNVGGIIDMSFVSEVKPDAVIYVWQGGMTGGLGAADVLTGKVSPSGKLADTIAKDISDYPSSPNFGSGDRDIYAEDIYVGYRYFETFAKDRVLYPFGFGLSYTTFEISDISAKQNGDKIELKVKVKNTGNVSGKEVVEVYVKAPEGKLKRPALTLCCGKKTPVLAPDESVFLDLCATTGCFSTYDDTGASGHRFCYVIEEGRYDFYVGNSVRAEKFVSLDLKETVLKQCSQALAPVIPFERMINQNGKIAYEPAPLNETDEKKRRTENLPKEIPQTGDKGIKLADVKLGKNTLSEFIAQLSDEDLSCVIRGEGMSSPLVTVGTASAFGGVSENLRNFGIPAGCCDDGPSGMRLDCGTKAFSLPNGTLLACTFNEELLERLYSYTGMEVTANKVECLLGPGINIHRHPLNGRNFEYFSEDPLLTGKCAAAQLRGLHYAHADGTIKHFCANNRETNRHTMDSVVSERALREIYLKTFEIAVKEGGARSVMTTYGSLNGVWTAGNYDLCQVILREEWGFDGIVMTDWSAEINDRGEPPSRSNFAAMARARNDLYMVCPDASTNSRGDNTLSSLENGTLTRAELQRNAADICAYLMNSPAMARKIGEPVEIEIINRPAEDEGENADDVEFFDVKSGGVVPLQNVEAAGGKSFSFALEMPEVGFYKVTLTASSALSETAQTSVTLFTLGLPVAVFTFFGTGGENVSIEREIMCFSRFVTCRLDFAQSGLKLEDIRFEFSREFDGKALL